MTLVEITTRLALTLPAGSIVTAKHDSNSCPCGPVRHQGQAISSGCNQFVATLVAVAD